jgi:hypothetical protein
MGRTADHNCLYKLLKIGQLNQLIIYLKPPDHTIGSRLKEDFIQRLQYYDRNYTALLMDDDRQKKEADDNKNKGVEPLPKPVPAKMLFLTNDVLREAAFKKGVEDIKSKCKQMAASTHARVIFFAWHHDFRFDESSLESGVDYAQFLDEKTEECIWPNEAGGIAEQGMATTTHSVTGPASSSSSLAGFTATDEVVIPSPKTNYHSTDTPGKADMYARQINRQFEQHVQLEFRSIEASVQRIVKFTNDVDAAKAKVAYTMTLMCQRNALLEKSNAEKDIEVLRLKNLVAVHERANQNGNDTGRSHENMEELRAYVATLENHLLKYENRIKSIEQESQRLQQEKPEKKRKYTTSISARHISSPGSSLQSLQSSVNSDASNKEPKPDKRTEQHMQKSPLRRELRGKEAEEDRDNHMVACKLCHQKYPARQYDKALYRDCDPQPSFDEWICSGPGGQGRCPGLNLDRPRLLRGGPSESCRL